MKCDVCGRHDATAAITMIVNGKNAVRKVCAACIRRLQRGDAYAAQMAILATLEAPEQEVYCPTCGASWSDVRRRGTMGCADCYQAFDPLLQPLMVRLGGMPQHPGPSPAEETPADAGQARLARLREEMFAAVSAEEYERAAQLRDQIRALEREGGEKAE